MKIGGWGTRLRCAIVDQNNLSVAMKKLQASAEQSREQLQFGHSWAEMGRGCKGSDCKLS